MLGSRQCNRQQIVRLSPAVDRAYGATSAGPVRCRTGADAVRCRRALLRGLRAAARNLMPDYSHGGSAGSAGESGDLSECVSLPRTKAASVTLFLNRRAGLGRGSGSGSG